MSLSSWGSCLQAAGRTCRWLRVSPRRRWPVCVLPLLVHAFLFLTVSHFVLSLSRASLFLLNTASSTPSFLLPFFCTLFSFIPTSHLPFFVLVTMATAIFQQGGKAGGLMEDTGAYDTLAIHHCPSLSPLKSLSLQLTTARGKSCWTSAWSTPSCHSVCPVIVWQR